jgi:hypothetical protein
VGVQNCLDYEDRIVMTRPCLAQALEAGGRCEKWTVDLQQANEQLTTVTHMVVIKLVIGLKLSACGLLVSEIVSGR